jgi:LPS O-antigen subunit length determinant protein (WzzB/FepE family)
MNPLDLLLWALAIAGTIILISLATAIAYGTYKAIKGDKKEKNAVITKIVFADKEDVESYPPSPYR